MFVAWSTAVQDVMTQFVDQVKIRLISKVIKGISEILQKLLRFINDTIIWTFFLPLLFVSPVIFSLKLNKLLSLLLVKSKIKPTSFAIG